MSQERLKRGLLVVDLQIGLQPPDELLIRIGKQASEFDAVLMVRRSRGVLGDLALDIPRALVLDRDTLTLGQEVLSIMRALHCDAWTLCGLGPAHGILGAVFSLQPSGLRYEVRMDLCEGSAKEAAARVLNQLRATGDAP